MATSSKKKDRAEQQRHEREKGRLKRETRMQAAQAALGSHWDELSNNAQVFDGATIGDAVLGTDATTDPARSKKPAAATPLQRATWRYERTDCTASPLTCFKGCCCPCVQYGQNAALIHKKPCFDGAWWPWCLLWVCCVPFAGSITRTQLRRELGIEGNYGKDLVAHCCCICCSIVQETNELSHELDEREVQRRELLSSQKMRRE